MQSHAPPWHLCTSPVHQCCPHRQDLRWSGTALAIAELVAAPCQVQSLELTEQRRARLESQLALARAQVEGARRSLATCSGDMSEPKRCLEQLALALDAAATPAISHEATLHGSGMAEEAVVADELGVGGGGSQEIPEGGARGGGGSTLQAQLQRVMAALADPEATAADDALLQAAEAEWDRLQVRSLAPSDHGGVGVLKRRVRLYSRP